MQTDSVFACHIENNDFIVVDGEVKGYVYATADEEESDYLLFDVVDDDGEHTQYALAPFDTVTIVTSFLDEDSDEEAVYF